jgi:NADH-quinone oxidoreductase subunit G
VQVLRNEVRRVLPRDNEAINECWLSDRDRFSYTALDSDERLLKPMIREHGEWRETDWQTALDVTARALRRVVDSDGPDALGALAAPTSTVEEFYLLQKIMRALGSHNVDHRLRTRDFRDDAGAPAFPGLGVPIAELEQLDVALLIGANIRKDQPILAHRLRKGWLKRKTAIMAVNSADYSWPFRLSQNAVVPAAQMPETLARIVTACLRTTGKPIPDDVRALAGSSEPSAVESAIAARLCGDGKRHIVLGSAAMRHADAALLRALTQMLADSSGASVGMLCDANGAGAWLAGCVPHRSVGDSASSAHGQNALQMITTPRKAYIVFGAEPENDCIASDQALRALAAAEFVVSMSPFKSRASEYAQVLLPLAAFTETEGTFVNCEGIAQSFSAAVRPPGDARPGWKLLRVLGNLLNLPGFDYTSAAEVRAEVLPDNVPMPSRVQNSVPILTHADTRTDGSGDVPIYAVDAITRRARPLQMTKDAQATPVTA